MLHIEWCAVVRAGAITSAKVQLDDLASCLSVEVLSMAWCRIETGIGATAPADRPHVLWVFHSLAQDDLHLGAALRTGNFSSLPEAVIDRSDLILGPGRLTAHHLSSEPT